MAADPNSFRIDTLIACIRTSTNPQVHNRSLLLLSSLAKVVPDLILNHVMPIFTFMGANVLRQDDEYSAHVIEQVLYIPIMANIDY
jgi:U3 small nucleolar RNA-associated protein 10